MSRPFILLLLWALALIAWIPSTQAGLLAANSRRANLETLVDRESTRHASAGLLQEEEAHEYALTLESRRESSGEGYDEDGYSWNSEEGDQHHGIQDEQYWDDDEEDSNRGHDDWKQEKEEQGEQSETYHTVKSSTNKAEWKDAEQTTSQWSPTTTPTVWSSTTPLPSVNVPSAPLVTPSLQSALTPQRITLLTGQVIKARQRALNAANNSSSSSSDTITWLSPRPGDAFTTGEEISLQWSAPINSIPSIQLRLCVLRATIDLERAQSGSLSDDACGLAIQANSTQPSIGVGSQVSFVAPTVSSADSFFIVLNSNQAQTPLSPAAQATFALPGSSNDASPQQQRDLPSQSQLVSPAFVLAPQGVDLKVLNSLPIPSTSVAASADVQIQQADAGKARPFAWAWVVAPLLIISIILVICALVYSHRRGKRSARKLAMLQSREGEEKWREVTRREVDQLAQSTAQQAARYSMPTPLSHWSQSPSGGSMEGVGGASPAPAFDRPSPVDHYAYLPSNLSPSRPLQRGLTIQSSSSIAESRVGSSLCPRPSRKAVPYHKDDDCKAWASTVSAGGESSAPLLDRESTVRSIPSTVRSDALPPLPVPIPVPVPLSIPAVLRPRSMSYSIMPNPHILPRRPASYPMIPTQTEPWHSRSTCLSSSDSVVSSTTVGRVGTIYDPISNDPVKRAKQINDLYLHLRQALETPPTGNYL